METGGCGYYEIHRALGVPPIRPPAKPNRHFAKDVCYGKEIVL